MKKILRDFVLLVVGSFVLAVGIQCFLLPLKICVGGLSGFATLLYYCFSLPLPVTVGILNVFLFLGAFRYLPKDSLWKNAVGVLLLSFFLAISQPFCYGGEDTLLAAMFGGALTGLGAGLVLYGGGSTGGTDLAALILHRKIPRVSIALWIILLDSAVVLLSGFAFGSFDIVLYSVLCIAIGGKVTDMILVRGEFAKAVTIVSPYTEEIACDILKEMERGVTGIHSRGLYHRREGMMLYCVVRQRELPRLLTLIHHRDERAFTTVLDVRRVRGEGFEG